MARRSWTAGLTPISGKRLIESGANGKRRHLENGSAKYPAGLNNAFLFGTFNALSFQIVLGSPMVLYAKALGASATVLGIIAGMMPLLVISQIPAANYIGRVGFKKFVYAGWGIRVAFIFAIAVVPLLTFLAPASRLSLILFVLFIFNLSRGISSAAWLPWISSLVPTTTRGKYLATEQAFIGVASAIAFIIAAACLGNTPAAWQFALIFLISGVAGIISLRFLKRIPDAPVPDEIKTTRQPVPWRAMMEYGPFRQLLLMNLGWSFAYGGISAFTVAFLRSQAQMPEATILYVGSVFFLGGVLSLWFGAHMDRLGSKPVMIFSSLLWLAIISAWFLLAARILKPSPATILVLQFFMGIGASVFTIANVRLTMVITPQMGRTHFFALYSVVANSSLGLAPILWGIMIDFFAKTEFLWQGLYWNRFTIFFLGAEIMFVLTLILKIKLEEKAAGKVEELMREILLTAPQRLLAKLWPF
jgi:MFS family permease